MRNITFAIAFVVCSLLATAAIGGSQLDVRMTFDDESVLPAAPTGITISVANRGDAPLRLPASLWIAATNPEGQTTLLRAHPTSDGTSVVVPEDQRDVAAGSTREFRFDPSPMIVTSPFITDRHISNPGQYHLRAIFSDNVSRTGEFDGSKGVVSNDAILNVVLNSEDDRAVWEWMKRVGGGAWGDPEWNSHMTEFVNVVRERHPHSGYALYASVYYPIPDGDAKYAHLEEVIKRFPRVSFTDQVKLLLMHYRFDDDYATAYHRHDLQAAADEAEKARGLGADLIQHGRGPNTKRYAQQFLAKIPAREQIMKVQSQ